MSEPDSELEALLRDARSIAVVGAKDLESEDAYRIPQYMQAHGYRILPVNPKLDHVLVHRGKRHRQPVPRHRAHPRPRR